MNEYRVTFYDGLDSLTTYTHADSAEEIDQSIKQNYAFEIHEGMTYKIEKI